MRPLRGRLAQEMWKSKASNLNLADYSLRKTMAVRVYLVDPPALAVVQAPSSVRNKLVSDLDNLEIPSLTQIALHNSRAGHFVRLADLRSLALGTD